MLPEGDLENLALFWLEIQTYNSELKKLKSGFLLKTIFDRQMSKIQSILKPDRSLFMYFAHDTIIVSILNSLGLYKVYTQLSHLFNQLQLVLNRFLRYNYSAIDLH